MFRNYWTCKKCKKIFDSGKKSVRGSEIFDLKKCKNLMNHKDYTFLKIASMSSKNINSSLINDEIKSTNEGLNPKTQNETTQS